jgi:hypothetical protein
VATQQRPVTKAVRRSPSPPSMPPRHQDPRSRARRGRPTAIRPEIDADAG